MYSDTDTDSSIIWMDEEGPEPKRLGYEHIHIVRTSIGPHDIYLHKKKDKGIFFFFQPSVRIYNTVI